MGKRKIVVIVLVAGLCNLASWLWSKPVYAEAIPILKAVPAGLSSDVCARLTNQRQDLEQKRKAFMDAAARFNAKAPEQQSDAEYAALQAQRTQYIDLAKAFNKEVENAASPANKKLALTNRIAALNKQIKDTQTQLQGLGFKQRAEDFEQIGKISEEAATRLKSKLFLRVQELVREASEDAMQEKFLKKIKDLKPNQVKQMLAVMEKGGVSDPYFLAWLRSFKSNKSRQELVSDAEVVIKYVKTQQDLSESSEKIKSGSVDDKQEAALTLISLVLDHPLLKPVKGKSVLKAVSACTYDVGEAWFYIAVLNMNVKDLAAVTDKQLATQKFLIKRMEKLVQERNAVKAELNRPI